MLEQKLSPYGFRVGAKAVWFSVCDHNQTPNLSGISWPDLVVLCSKVNFPENLVLLHLTLLYSSIDLLQHYKLTGIDILLMYFSESRCFLSLRYQRVFVFVLRRKRRLFEHFWFCYLHM